MMVYLDQANDFLFRNPRTRDWIIILSSLMIDVVLLFVAYFFWRDGKTARIMNSLFVFYLIRGICQAFFFMQYPEKWCYEDPGFFSIVVPYGKAADFYFSGHSGFLLVSTLELIHMKMIGLAFLNFLSMIYTAWMLVSTRAHYSIGTAR
jgi:hypothetical protein